jgi:hypothetical protein
MLFILLLPLADIAVPPRERALQVCAAEAQRPLVRYAGRDVVHIELEPEAGVEDSAWEQLGSDEHWWRHMAGVHARVEIYFDGPTEPQRARLHEQAALARRALDRCVVRR